MGTDEHPVSQALASAGRRKDWLARQLGIHPTLLSHYLAGRRQPPDEFYTKAAGLIGVPTSWLKPKGERVA